MPTLVATLQQECKSHCYNGFTAGLAMLSGLELRKMIREMENKFSRMSEVLVCDLTCRDKLVIELGIKNKFISALLQVQSLRHSSSQSSGSRFESMGRALAAKSKQSEDKTNIHVRAIVSCLFLNF